VWRLSNDDQQVALTNDSFIMFMSSVSLLSSAFCCCCCCCGCGRGLYFLLHRTRMILYLQISMIYYAFSIFISFASSSVYERQHVYLKVSMKAVLFHWQKAAVAHGAVDVFSFISLLLLCLEKNEKNREECHSAGHF
jgi:hypothetical protein